MEREARKHDAADVGSGETVTAMIIPFGKPPAERRSFAHLASPQLRLVAKACTDEANAGRFELHILIVGGDANSNSVFRPRPDRTYTMAELGELFMRGCETLCALEG